MRRRLFKLGWICLIFVLAVACGARKKEVNLTKDGTLFEFENVSFIHPDEFKEETSSTEKPTLRDVKAKSTLFKKEDQSFSLEIMELVENNSVEELIQLFRVDIESTGATILSNTKVTLTNGDSCYELVSQNGDVKEKYLVIFEEGKRYCLKYRAPIDVYDENILDIDKFLYTFTVKEQGE